MVVSEHLISSNCFFFFIVTSRDFFSVLFVNNQKNCTITSFNIYSVKLTGMFYRMSRWNHTKIFSDLVDEETRISDGGFGNKSISGRQSKYSAGLQSKASLLRLVDVCFTCTMMQPKRTT